MYISLHKVRFPFLNSSFHCLGGETIKENFFQNLQQLEIFDEVELLYFLGESSRSRLIIELGKIFTFTVARASISNFLKLLIRYNCIKLKMVAKSNLIFTNGYD